MKRTRMQHALARCLIAAFRVMARLPLRASRAVGTAIGATAWRLNTRPARITALNIEACFPRLSRRQRTELCRASLIETGRVIAEMGFAWYGKDDALARSVRVVEGADLLGKPAAQGTILIMPHFGNWEIFAYALRHTPIMCLYAPPRVAGLEREMIRARGRWGSTMVAADVRGLRAVKRTLEKGDIVGVLPDQTPAPEAGVRAPFFGQQALTMTLVHRLLRTRPQVILATAQRTNSGFDVRFAHMDDRIYDPDTVTSATAMNAAIESAVLRELAQYQWEYNRFRYRLP